MCHGGRLCRQFFRLFTRGGNGLVHYATSVLTQPSAKRNIGIYFGQLQILLVERFVFSSFTGSYRSCPGPHSPACFRVMAVSELCAPVKRLCSIMREKGMPPSEYPRRPHPPKSGSSKISSSKRGPWNSDRPGLYSKAFRSADRGSPPERLRIVYVTALRGMAGALCLEQHHPGALFGPYGNVRPALFAGFAKTSSACVTAADGLSPNCLPYNGRMLLPIHSI